MKILAKFLVLKHFIHLGEKQKKCVAHRYCLSLVVTGKRLFKEKVLKGYYNKLIVCVFFGLGLYRVWWKPFWSSC